MKKNGLPYFLFEYASITEQRDAAIAKSEAKDEDIRKMRQNIQKTEENLKSCMNELVKLMDDERTNAFKIRRVKAKISKMWDMEIPGYQQKIKTMQEKRMKYLQIAAKCEALAAEMKRSYQMHDSGLATSNVNSENGSDAFRLSGSFS